MSKQSDFGPIYEHMLSHCRPYRHAEPWQDLSAPEDIRLLPEDPGAMIDDLRLKFSDVQLQEAGVVVMDETISLQPAPALYEGERLIAALRKTEKHEPFDLLTSRGTLSGQTLPLCASLRDARVRGLIRSTGDRLLCGVTTMVDLAVLRSLRLPATLVAGLAELRGGYLRQVRKSFNLYPPKPGTRGGIIYHDDEKPNKGKPLDLVLVGCQLSDLTLKEPAELSRIASHLAEVERYLDVPFEQFYKWCPSQETIKRIAFCTERAEVKKARAAILDSIDSSTVQLIVHATEVRSPENLADASETLARLRAKPRRDLEEERRAWEDVLRAIEKDSIAPLQKAAEACSDPIERSYWTLATMNSRILYPELTRLTLRSQRGSAQATPGGLSAFPKEEFRQVMQLYEAQRKNLKGITDCRKDPYRQWK